MEAGEFKLLPWWISSGSLCNIDTMLIECAMRTEPLKQSAAGYSFHGDVLRTRMHACTRARALKATHMLMRITEVSLLTLSTPSTPHLLTQSPSGRPTLALTVTLAGPLELLARLMPTSSSDRATKGATALHGLQGMCPVLSTAALEVATVTCMPSIRRAGR